MDNDYEDADSAITSDSQASMSDTEVCTSEDINSTLTDLPSSTAHEDKVEDTAKLTTIEVDFRKNGLKEVSNAPKWDEKLLREGIKGFQFNSDYSLFWCMCGKSPYLGWKTGGSRSNLMKHRRTGACTFSTKQRTLGKSSSSQQVSQTMLRKLLRNAVVSCSLPFSIVEQPSFKSLLTMGQGRQHLQVPALRTVVRDISSSYSEVLAILKDDIVSSQSKVSITFDL